MKSIKAMLSTTILTGTILLSINTTVYASTNYTTQITNMTNTKYTINIDNKNYTFENEDNSYNINDKVIATVDNNELTQIKPYFTHEQLKTINNIGIPSETTYTNKLTTDVELQQYAQQWLKDNYNMTLDIPVTFDKIINNNESYSVNGRIYFTDNKPTNIVINSDLIITDNTNFITERALIHELTHYIMCKQGLPYLDNDILFQQECIKNGTSINDLNGTKGILHSHVKIVQEF